MSDDSTCTKRTWADSACVNQQFVDRRISGVVRRPVWRRGLRRVTGAGAGAARTRTRPHRRERQQREGRLREVLIQFRQWAPELRPIVISHETRDEDDAIESLIGAGAKGYLKASATVEEFRVALENVREGSIWAPRKVLSRLVQAQTGMSARRGGPRRRVVCGSRPGKTRLFDF